MSWIGSTIYPAAIYGYGGLQNLTYGFDQFMIVYKSNFDIRKINKIWTGEFWPALFWSKFSWPYFGNFADVMIKTSYFDPFCVGYNVG